MSASFVDSLSVAAIFTAGLQSLFLILFLLCRQSRRTPANLALAAAAGAFFLCMVDDFLDTLHFYEPLPLYASCIAGAIPSLIGPLIYLHVEGQIAGPSWRFKKRHLRHGIVFAILVCGLIAAICDPLPREFAQPDYLQSKAFLHTPQLLQIVFLTFASFGAFLITAIQGPLYLWAMIRLTRRQFPGEDGAVRASWLRMLLYGVAGLLVLFVAGTVAAMATQGKSPLSPAISIAYALILYGIAWTSLHHGAVFQRPPEKMLGDLVAPLIKYRKSAQSDEDAKRIVGKIEAAILREHLYRQNSLSLPVLAALIGTTPNAVSQAINQHVGLNFFDFINRYRIEEAKNLLRDRDGQENSLLDIAFAVGFNSKSTFNSAFKKFSGVTPGAFRDQQAGSSL